MKPKILRTDADIHIIESKLEALSRVADVITCSSNDEETLARKAEDADLILVCYTRITARVIESAWKLKGIVKYGVGVDNIDLKAATMRGIPVINCPDYGSETVADHAFALMICLARKMIKIHNAVRERAWVWPSPEYMGVDLFGKTLGIIGLGRIGMAIARRAEGFGMTRIAFDPNAKEELARRHAIKLTDLDELLRLSDFVSIHCTLTPETTGLIGENEFRKMKKTAFIIDVSRGAIIDESALVTALDRGWITGAGLDVFSEEPLKTHNPLLAIDNVILTPHLAWYTKEAFERLESETIQRTSDILQGKTPKNVVNIEVLEKCG
jgi:D-3-phosphoglycerate dehydrogenase